MASAERLPTLIRALLRPQNHSPPPAACELVETHISWVILAGERVYKIKKPLDLGFLDFSTLEKRRFYCEEELRLNRRLAPGIYQQVVAISGSPDQPLLGAGGQAFEYAVQMHRFPQQAQLDRMLACDALTPAHIDAFARLAADFHSRVAVAQAQSPYGGPQQVWQPVAENFAQIREHLHGERGSPALRRLEQWSREVFARLGPLLEQRKQSGFIRECHGDMHLRNLAWIDGRAVAFDCIEFNPALRWIDVISEIAFMVMDLQARGEPRLAQRFLNGYLEQTGEYAGLDLLPFYRVYRAMVRAKVAAIELGQHQAPHHREELNDYLDLAASSIRRDSPALLITMGFSGSGKSTVTDGLLQSLGAVRLRSDVERTRLYGEADSDQGIGTGKYSTQVSEQLYRHLQQQSRHLLQAGYTVIVDAAFLQRARRQPFAELADACGVPFHILALQAEPDVLRERIRHRQQAGQDASEADLAVLEAQLQHHDPLDEREQARTLEIDTAQPADPNRLAARLRRHSRQ